MPIETDLVRELSACLLKAGDQKKLVVCDSPHYVTIEDCERNHDILQTILSRLQKRHVPAVSCFTEAIEMRYSLTCDAMASVLLIRGTLPKVFQVVSKSVLSAR